MQLYKLFAEMLCYESSKVFTYCNYLMWWWFRQGNMERDLINWNLCFICQKQKKRINVDQLKMATSIYWPYCLNFKKNGLLFCLDKLKWNYDTLENALIKKEAKYHKKCYSNFGEGKLKQAKDRQNKCHQWHK